MGHELAHVLSNCCKPSASAIRAEGRPLRQLHFPAWQQQWQLEQVPSGSLMPTRPTSALSCTSIQPVLTHAPCVNRQQHPSLWPCGTSMAAWALQSTWGNVALGTMAPRSRCQTWGTAWMWNLGWLTSSSSLYLVRLCRSDSLSPLMHWPLTIVAHGDDCGVCSG